MLERFARTLAAITHKVLRRRATGWATWPAASTAIMITLAARALISAQYILQTALRQGRQSQQSVHFIQTIRTTGEMRERLGVNRVRISVSIEFAKLVARIAVAGARSKN